MPAQDDNDTVKKHHDDDDDEKMKTNNKQDTSCGGYDQHDTWAATAEWYDEHVTRLTERYGFDLIGLIRQDILSAATILDVGCGTGAFVQAYLQHFPRGVAGQTLILSDLSPAMIDKARAKLAPVLLANDDGGGGDGFATKIIFQVEDGTKLAGIDDNSIDVVVSLFGVFLIPDQAATLRAIQRVLRRGCDRNDATAADRRGGDDKSGTTAAAFATASTGIFANASWVFDVTGALRDLHLGPSLQDVFATPTRIIDPTKSIHTMPFLQFWSDGTKIREALLSTTTKGDDNNNDDDGGGGDGHHRQWSSVQVHRVCHSSVWQFPMLWRMLLVNPMSSIIRSASPEVVQRAKEATLALVMSTTGQQQQQKQQPASSGLSSSSSLDDDDEPVILSSIANLTVCRGLMP